MKVLMVSGRTMADGRPAPFVAALADALTATGEVESEWLGVGGNGAWSYVKSAQDIRQRVKRGGFQLVHAHYGLSGLVAVSQRIVPAVVSFTGCDVNRRDLRPISRLVMRGAAHSIFVTDMLAAKANARTGYTVLPYGVDPSVFHPVDRLDARRQLGLPEEDHIALFPSSRKREEKNFPLAEGAARRAGVRLLELERGYTPREVNLLINSSNLILLTSIREGSPQVIKEALACDVPIVATDVGDVKARIGGIRGCYVTSFDVGEIAGRIQEVLADDFRPDGRRAVADLTWERVAAQVLEIYRDAVGGSGASLSADSGRVG